MTTANRHEISATGIIGREVSCYRLGALLTNSSLGIHFAELTGPLLDPSLRMVYFDQRASGRSDPSPDGVYTLVEVSKVPCRAEIDFVGELVGEKLPRVRYIPAGDAACAYRSEGRC